MNCLAIIGFATLGTFVGVLVSWAMSSRKEPEGKTYVGLITAVAGAAAGFIPLFSANKATEMWFYPIGLMIGLIILGPLLDTAYNWFYGLKWVKDLEKRAR